MLRGQVYLGARGPREPAGLWAAVWELPVCVPNSLLSSESEAALPPESSIRASSIFLSLAPPPLPCKCTPYLHTQPSLQSLRSF